jgi:hypothetical protein
MAALENVRAIHEGAFHAMEYLSSIITIANLAKLLAGGLVHKAGSYLYGKFKGAEAKVKTVVADVKKDL